MVSHNDDDDDDDGFKNESTFLITEHGTRTKTCQFIKGTTEHHGTIETHSAAMGTDSAGMVSAVTGKLTVRDPRCMEMNFNPGFLDLENVRSTCTATLF